MLDTLIVGAEVYDGNGGDPKQVSVGIQGDRIAYVGEDPGATAAKKRIDGKGKWLSPGFIDSHASTGLGYLRKGGADNKLFQGVTTELIGNCGTSTAPIGDALVDTMEQQGERIGFDFSWRSLEEYYARVDDFGLPINLATLVGHSTLRGGHLKDWKHIASEELSRMCEELDKAMEQGSFGMSSGLIYPPGCYADISELIELGKVVAKHGGFYASHIRDERGQVEDAVNEAMEIGRGAGIPVLVSHLKSADKPNWGKVPKLLENIEQFRDKHKMNIIVDVYPYTAVSTKLRAFLPKEILKDGIEAVSEKLANPEWRERCIRWMIERETGLDEMIIISEDIPDTCGKRITEIAEMWGVTPQEAACDLVKIHPEIWMVYHCIDEADMDSAVLWPDAVICSDSWSYPVNAKTSIGNPHPRTYGAFSRFLDRYVFSRPKLSYGDAVRKITSMTADFMGMRDRGRIREGAYADVLLMDPNTFEDRASYTNPRQFSGGVDHLWINGELAIEAGALVNDKRGRVVRPV